MKYISHRGFVNGFDRSIENNPNQILSLINKQIDIEIDVRYFNGSFYLGHDEPIFKIETHFLENEYLWCHAKTYETLEMMAKTKCHYFWHQDDDYTITSKGFVWVYPGKPLIKNSICVLPEKFNQDYSSCHGICTDFISKYINL